RQCAGPYNAPQVEGLTIVVIGYVLHRIDVGTGIPAVADLCDVVQPQLVGKYSSGAHSNGVDRHNSTVVLKVEEERTAQCSLHQRTVVIGSAIKTDSRVIAPKLKIQPVIHRVDQLQALQINAKLVGYRVCFYYRLRKKAG